VVYIRVSFHQLLCSSSKQTWICYEIYFAIKCIFLSSGSCFQNVKFLWIGNFVYDKFRIPNSFIPLTTVAYSHPTQNIERVLEFLLFIIPCPIFVLIILHRSTLQTLKMKSFLLNHLIFIYLTYCYILLFPHLLLSYSFLFYFRICCTLCVFVVLCVYCCSYFKCWIAG